MNVGTGIISARPSLREFGAQLPRLAVGIEQVVRKSFERRPMRNLTYQAKRERVDFCVRMAMEMRHSMHWGVERIVDTLPLALDCHLEGVRFEPDRRRVWVETDGL